MIVPGLIVMLNAPAPEVGVRVMFAPPPGYVNVDRLPVLLNVTVPVPAGVTVPVVVDGTQVQVPRPVLVNVICKLCGAPVPS